MNFQLTTSERPGVLVVTVAGELDIASAPHLSGVLEGSDGAGVVVVDLTATEFMDSSGVRTLAYASRVNGGRFALVCPASNLAVTRVLELTGFGEALTVHETLDELDPSSTEH